MKPTLRLGRGGTGVLLLAAFASVAVWAQELSHARIVRLSFTEGVVTVQRPDVDEWANAPTNTPIQEGFKIATGDGAFAEVEFENVSTARIGQLSLLEFTQLALLPSGGKVNRMKLSQGYATFNTIPEDEDFYEVTAGSATLTPQGKSRFRVDVEEGILQVKVFKGSVEIMSPEGTGTLGKNTVLEVRPGGEEPFQISQGITKDAWDEWVEERESRIDLVRHQGAPKLYSNNVGDLVWGMMDLMSYGNWTSFPGYGYGWTPRVGLGWSPYSSGRWCWYPTMGYTWISHEPWGWLPYHYGAWIYDPIIGWAWIPTGGFGTWSPALVSWYQGPGWVGWAPMSPMLGGSSYNCPRREGCVAIASTDEFRAGRPIRPDGLRWGHPDSGRPVRNVDVQPERAAMLPGSSHEGLEGFRRGPGRDGFGRASDRVATSGSVSRTLGAAGDTVNPPDLNEPGVVLDPETNRYVNNPVKTISPVTPPTPGEASERPAASRGAFRGTGTIQQGTRPGPQTNYPAPVARGIGGPGAIAPRGERGNGSSDATRETGTRRGAWSSSGDTARTSGSATRTGSTAGAKSESSSRSSAGSGSSVSSGGGRSSGGSSSGWGGGSSSGGRSSGWSSGGWSGGSSSSGGGGGRSGGGSSGGSGGGGGSHGPSGGGGSRSPR